MNEREDDIWQIAEAARKEEFSRSLRNKLLWGDQSVVVVCGLIKVFFLTAAIAIIVGQIGFPNPFNRTVAVLLVLPLLIFNPRQLFWRNIFSERADLAFKEAVRKHRS
jgi:hypothetical protein